MKLEDLFESGDAPLTLDFLAEKCRMSLVSEGDKRMTKITTKRIEASKYIVTDGEYEVELHKVFGWNITAIRNQKDPGWHLRERHHEVTTKGDAVAIAKAMIERGRA